MVVWQKCCNFLHQFSHKHWIDIIFNQSPWNRHLVSLISDQIYPYKEQNTSNLWIPEILSQALIIDSYEVSLKPNAVSMKPNTVFLRLNSVYIKPRIPLIWYNQFPSNRIQSDSNTQSSTHQTNWYPNIVLRNLRINEDISAGNFTTPFLCLAVFLTTTKGIKSYLLQKASHYWFIVPKA